jgi:hypothetical protein
MRRKLRAFPVLFALMALAVGAPAVEAEGLEGVWSFSGGAVAVQKLPDGTFQGTVVEPTTFAVCRHPVGQVMWIAMTRESDGSYWGLHQWFHGSNCRPDGPFGRTAWRVISAPAGRRLEVCFNSPGESLQPRIEADGSSADVSYGCAESEPLAAVPGSGANSLGIESFVGLPAGSFCSNRRRLRIFFRHVRYDPLAKVVVWVNGRKAAVVESGETAKRSILLENLPEAGFSLRIVAVTALHQRFWKKRSYRACRHRGGEVKRAGESASSKR